MVLEDSARHLIGSQMGSGQKYGNHKDIVWKDGGSVHSDLLREMATH